MKFLLIAIAIWICALVIWWMASNAFRHSDQRTAQKKATAFLQRTARYYTLGMRT